MSQVSTVVLLLLAFLADSVLTEDREERKYHSWPSSDRSTRPNIILILADDLGFNDVSFHGSNQIFTPNFDSLAYEGIILNNYYVPALCTPSRGALLTGQYPIHIGLQHFVIPSDEPWGMPPGETTMAEVFRDAGYSTHIVGKWHLGFHEKKYTPTFRGFEEHIGYLGPYIDYWDHSLIMLDRNYSRGFDMRKNQSMFWESKGTYATDLFNDLAVQVIKDHDTSKPLFLYIPHLAPHTANENDPMQAPDDEIAKQSHISDQKRRTYAAMVSKFDEGIGKVMKALSNKGMLQNSIVVVYADNGGPTLGLHSNSGSNGPLRGQKNSPWEGGIRSAGAIWSPLLLKKRRVSRQLMYSTDWFPTLASAAGIKLSRRLSDRLDGHNMWPALSLNLPSPRNEILHNIDDIFGYSAFLQWPYKYINGTTVDGKFDGWLGAIPAEPNPLAIEYAQSILKSTVSRVLGSFNREKGMPRLTERDIRVLREKARVQCRVPSNVQTDDASKCNPLQSPCLFNIALDPCEQVNLAKSYPYILERLARDVEGYRRSAVPSRRVPSDPQCDPALHNYTWTWWRENEVQQPDKRSEGVCDAKNFVRGIRKESCENII